MKQPLSERLGLDEGAVGSLLAVVPYLHSWYRANARDLPWRRTRDPYAVWVSEVMLQQTRVATAIPYFERWMSAFPAVEALARADEGQVFHHWEGLGYYSRARNLYLAARDVAERYGGRVPSDPGSFRSLPGVGAYTAAAVLSIAFGLDFAVLDGNVRRVLARLAALSEDPRRATTSRALEGLAAALLPPGTAATHNQALMELGALLCTPRAPACGSCPLAAPCRGRSLGDPEAYPRPSRKKEIPHHDVALGLVFHEGRVFIDRRPYGGMLGGLWEFPGGKLEAGEEPRQALRRELWEEFGMVADIGDALPTVDHAYTHLRVTLHPFLCRFRSMDAGIGEGRPHRWVDPAELPDHAMPRGNRRILEGLTLAPPAPVRQPAPQRRRAPP